MSSVTAREHHWDSLRAFLMLLGIPYHTAMAYNARVLWDIQSPDKSDLLTSLSGVLVTFRMPAFFIVAGYFAAMMLEKRPPSTWLRGRLTRLGIPFLTGLVLLAPLQIILIDLDTALIGTAPMAEALDQAARDVTHPGFGWIMHLWFLPALMAYSILLVLIRRLAMLDSIGPALVRARDRCTGSPASSLALLVLSIAVWEVLVNRSHMTMLSMDGTLPYLIGHGIDPYLRYVPFFFLGVIIRTAPDIRVAFVWQKGWAVPAIAAVLAIFASLLRGRESAGLEVAYNAVDGAAALLVSLVVIGIAQRFWNRPDARVERIVDASFSIYLLHHPVIFALGTVFLLAAWPPIAEFTLICLVTFLLSYAAHRIIRRFPLALLLFNGVPIPSKPADSSPSQDRITTLR